VDKGTEYKEPIIDADGTIWIPSGDTYVPTHGPQTESTSPGIDQIPFVAIESIGRIFAEGEQKYGRDNWKRDPSNESYNAERGRHALRHLYLYLNGDRSEDHLAKVAWYCVTTLWRTNQPTK
jgi:hypothetical protein